MRYRPRGLRRRTEVVLWCALFAVWIAALLIRHHLLGATECRLGGSSLYGTQTWSWFPPGTECTYVLEDLGISYTTGPDPWAYVLPTILAVWGLALFRWRPLMVEESVEPPEGSQTVSDADVERRELLQTLASLPDGIHEVVDLVMANDHPEREVQERLGCNRAGAEYVVSTLLHWLTPRRQENIRVELAERWRAE